jgi:hypothetical protein
VEAAEAAKTAEAAVPAEVVTAGERVVVSAVFFVNEEEPLITLAAPWVKTPVPSMVMAVPPVRFPVRFPGRRLGSSKLPGV